MSDQYSVVMTTVSSDDAATSLAEALLRKQLAACIQVVPIKSHYTWKGSLQVDSEQLLMIKSKHSNFSAIRQCIVENHSYEVPEIIEVPIIAGSPEYLSWIDDVTR